MVSLGGTLGWGPVLHGWVGVRARGRGSFPGSVLPMVPTCDSSSSACVRETVCARDRDHLRGCHHGHGDCRKGDPFQGLRGGSWLLLRNELSKETHMLTKQETLLERVESSRVREPIEKDGGEGGGHREADFGPRSGPNCPPVGWHCALWLALDLM